MKNKTNFDIFLEEQLQEPELKKRFEQAGEAWEVALQLAALRKTRGLSQKQLADKIGTSHQQISRLESPSYQGHSFSMLRRVVEALGGSIKVEILLKPHKAEPMVAEDKGEYYSK